MGFGFSADVYCYDSMVMHAKVIVIQGGMKNNTKARARTAPFYEEGGCAVATVSPVAALWDTSMKPGFFGSVRVLRFFL